MIMKSIDLLHIKFTKKDLECISEDESIFVLQVGGLIYEVILPRKRLKFPLILLPPLKEGDMGNFASLLKGVVSLRKKMISIIDNMPGIAASQNIVL